MRNLSKTAFSKLTVAQKVALANLSVNTSVIQTTLAMCDPHGKILDYAGDRMAELADCVYEMDGKLKGPNANAVTAPTPAEKLAAARATAYGAFAAHEVDMATNPEYKAVADQEMTRREAAAIKIGRKQ